MTPANNERTGKRFQERRSTVHKRIGILGGMSPESTVA